LVANEVVLKLRIEARLYVEEAFLVERVVLSLFDLQEDLLNDLL
jgi:hypothetical protein